MQLYWNFYFFYIRRIPFRFLSRLYNPYITHNKYRLSLMDPRDEIVL